MENNEIYENNNEMNDVEEINETVPAYYEAEDQEKTGSIGRDLGLIGIGAGLGVAVFAGIRGIYKFCKNKVAPKAKAAFGKVFKKDDQEEDPEFRKQVEAYKEQLRKEHQEQIEDAEFVEIEDDGKEVKNSKKK